MIEQQKIEELVDNNYIYASVLYYFGIEFYNYSDLTLEQACQKKGLNIKSVIRKLESPIECNDKFEIAQLPIELIIEYLKHTHFIFIKQKLPYMGHLIANLATKSEYHNIAKDLKFVFPLFVEDFIHHIYQEEDTLFNYISRLDSFKKGKGQLSHLFLDMEKNSLSLFASEHEEHDDEMVGIRNITNDYNVGKNAPLHLKVIYAELESLEKDLQVHARIENEILFPKALMLEKEVSGLMKDKIRYN